MYNRENYINSSIDIEEELLFLLDKNNVKTVFDIGACEAEDSIRYSKLFPNSIVYAFEPRQDNIALGQASIEKYNCKNVVLENIALSNKNGKAEFFLSDGAPDGLKNNTEWDYGNKSSSLLAPTEEIKKHTGWLQFNKKTEVDTLRLEDYAKNKQISCIDFVHIDVQGAELMVLEGAGDFLKQIKLLWMEVEAVELYQNQPLKNDVELFMRKNGFINIYDTVNHIAGDQLYANTAFFSKKVINQFEKLKDKRTFFQKLKFTLKKILK